MNPLLARTLPIPFPAITADALGPAVDATLAEANAALDAIQKGPASYASTLGALEDATVSLEHVAGIASHLEAVLDWPEFREAYNAVQPALATFGARLATDAGLFAALSMLRSSPALHTLDPVQVRHVQKTWEELQRSGAGLDTKDKARLAALEVELTDLTTRFSQNAVDAQAAFELIVHDPNALAGLPDSARAAAEASAKSVGKDGYRFTLDGPSYVAALTYLDDAALREKLYRAHSTRAAGENAALIGRILELRREKARLLGFANFADLVLQERMAGSGAEARAFVQNTLRAAEPAFRRETEELTAFRRQLEGSDAPPLAAWDVSYYAEKLRKERYALDDEQLRPYFALERVLAGMFDLARKLFDVHVTQIQGLPVWHDDVRVYQARRGDRDLGVFYLDLHPRPGKRDGAWMHGLQDNLPGAPGVGLIVANMTKPDEHGQCLLLHREVATLFHEFGHLLHHMLSEVPVRALAGTKVAWDFVELPSQILENWTWEPEALASFALHHQTGEPLPADLAQRLQTARSFRAASALVRQLGFSSVDLALHVDYDPANDGDVLAYSRAILERHSPTALPADHAMVASFLHLFSSPVGYAAGYYSYQWAEALEADAFARFREVGLFDRGVGDAFAEHVLSRGNSAEPRDLFRAFRGRDVDLQAMLRRISL